MPADPSPRSIRLEDYRPPAFLVDTVALRVELDEHRTLVHSRVQMRRNPGAAERPADLVLDGRSLELVGIALDGEPLAPERHRLDESSLTVRDAPESFLLETTAAVNPGANTSLEGLYRSAGNFCTQCEAEGFRRITWFPDRPDVMARYSTTLVGDPMACPVMLSNGDAVERGTLADGRHWVRYEDPFPKPSYLFALVAGDLACIEDSFTTRSGRRVALRIFVEHHNRDRCGHAMDSLRKAMLWDEQLYGLEYDLDTYMIVAVDDFNMGAMENKGLNVFNSKYVLADPRTATDHDYASIEGVIGHEYFHNWTGNRVTCRDWFQLSLKEGLTVFRDQEFSADQGSRAVKRVQDVRTLRTHQFAEDAGPMAHPVRPDRYIEISNFYTVTVYNKGAEVIRMIQTLLGAEGFRSGLDLYLRRHDGQAVTTEDFLRSMEDATGADLAQFRRWYTQAGTPEVAARGRHDAATGRYHLTLSQSCASSPGQPTKQPFHIPVAIGLVAADGRDLPLRLQGTQAPAMDTMLLELREPEQHFELEAVEEAPILSAGRGFSAPVKLRISRDDTDLAFLMGHDRDPVNRWDAAQEYATSLLLRGVEEHRAQGSRQPSLPEPFVAAFGRTLEDTDLDPALVAEALTLPSESYLADRLERIDTDAIHSVRRSMRHALAQALTQPLLHTWRRTRSSEPYRYDPPSAGRRSLANLCLGYLMERDDGEIHAACLAQFREADNMTDTLAALACLAHRDCAEREVALGEFERRWHEEPLVLDKWFTLQATSPLPGTLERVRELTGHPRFSMGNPNRVRALIGAFSHGNPLRFHEPSGGGYRFLAERVMELDARNPQIAARLLGAFSRWRRFDPDRRARMRSELERILSTPRLSKDTYEIASKTLST